MLERSLKLISPFTEKQGQYLAFIESYIAIHGKAPAEADIRNYFKTSPPTIHQMILKLEKKKDLLVAHQGQARSIKLLIDTEVIPKLKRL